MKKKSRKRIFVYTHVDKEGILWRFEGVRPISILADQVMADMEWPPPKYMVELANGGITRNVENNKKATPDNKQWLKKSPSIKKK